MAITRNLWVLYPLAAGVSSGIGTLQSGLSFTWADAGIGVAVLVLQAVVLMLIFRGASKKSVRSVTEI